MKNEDKKYVLQVLRDVRQVARLFTEGNPIAVIAEYMEYSEDLIEEMLRTGVSRR